MNTRESADYIQAKLELGEFVVILASHEPERYHKRVYKALHRRGVNKKVRIYTGERCIYVKPNRPTRPKKRV